MPPWGRRTIFTYSSMFIDAGHSGWRSFSIPDDHVRVLPHQTNVSFNIKRLWYLQGMFFDLWHIERVRSWRILILTYVPYPRPTSLFLSPMPLGSCNYYSVSYNFWRQAHSHKHIGLVCDVVWYRIVQLDEISWKAARTDRTWSGWWYGGRCTATNTDVQPGCWKYTNAFSRQWISWPRWSIRWWERYRASSK